VIQILRSLKYSNKQITGACAVAMGAKQQINSPADARKLIASCGIYAEDACRASILLQNSPEEALSWIEKSQAPASISDLKISGRDLMALGLLGREIGETLQALFLQVLEDPRLNEKEKLLNLVQKVKQD